MKLSRGARRDNLLCRFFSVSQRLNIIKLFNVCANKLSLSLSLYKARFLPLWTAFAKVIEEASV